MLTTANGVRPDRCDVVPLGAVREPLCEDEFIGTTGDEDSAWEEEHAQWGADEDPLEDVAELEPSSRIDTAD